VKVVPAIQVHLFDPEGRPAPFRLAFYGARSLLDLAGLVELALNRRGLTGYTVNHALTRRTY
jgi:hypothetical protein